MARYPAKADKEKDVLPPVVRKELPNTQTHPRDQ